MLAGATNIPTKRKHNCNQHPDPSVSSVAINSSTIQQHKMPKMNYRKTQDSEIRTSESESEHEEERIDIRNAPAEHHKAKKRIYYDRARSQSIEYAERRRSPSEERPRKIRQNTNMKHERSGHRPQYRDESFPVHKVPTYQSWSTEKPATRRKCPREHTVYQTQPDKGRVVEKKERKATATRPATTPAAPSASVPTIQPTSAAQPGPTPTAQLAATQIIQPAPVLGIQSTSAAQINQQPATLTGAQMTPDFLFKTLEYIEKIVRAGHSKRSVKPDAIQVDLSKVKTEKTECITIREENSDDCEDKQTKAETDVEGSASTMTDSTINIEEQSMEVEKPTNTRKRINKMVKIMRMEDLKEQKS